MQLIGHAGEVYSMRFSPDGDCIASGSYDRTILLWRTYGECENYVLLRGHKSAVLEVHWFTSGEHILSCSADKTVRCWDAQAGVQIKRLTEHTSFVNSCCPMRRGPPLFVSGSDDGNAKVRLLEMPVSLRQINKYVAHLAAVIGASTPFINSSAVWLASCHGSCSVVQCYDQVFCAAPVLPWSSWLTVVCVCTCRFGICAVNARCRHYPISTL